MIHPGNKQTIESPGLHAPNILSSKQAFSLRRKKKKQEKAKQNPTKKMQTHTKTNTQSKPCNK